MPNFFDVFSQLSAYAASVKPPVDRKLDLRLAGSEPSSNVSLRYQQVLEDGLRLLGSKEAAGSFLDTHIAPVYRNLVRPEEFQKPYIHEWLAEPEVREALKTLAIDKVFDRELRPEARELALRRCVAHSGEAVELAEVVVARAVNFLATALSQHHDAMDQAGHSETHWRLQGLGQAVDKMATAGPTVSDAVREHQAATARQELDRILLSRGSPGTKPLEALQHLRSDLDVVGRLGLAPEQLRDEVDVWIARLLATNGRADEARAILAKLANASGPDVEIVLALIDAEESQVDRALRRLRALDTADARGCIVSVLLRKRSAEDAVAYVDTIVDIGEGTFTPTGWRLSVSAAIGAKDYRKTEELLDRVPHGVLEVSGRFWLVRGALHCIQIFPTDFHDQIMDGVILKPDGLMLEGESAGVNRRGAAAAFAQARDLARLAGDYDLQDLASTRVLWMQLADPAQRDHAVAEVQASMRDPATAVGWVEFAHVLGIEFDSTPIRTYLRQQELLGGLDAEQAFAMFRLLSRDGNPDELRNFVDWNKGNLSDPSQVPHVVHDLVSAYCERKRPDDATSLLNEYRSSLAPRFLRLHEIMIADCRGEDPVDTLIELYASSRAPIDLANVVNVLERQRRWSELQRWSHELFRSLRTVENARRHLRCLERLNQPPRDILAFLDECDDLVEVDDDLLSARAWMLFHMGKLREAKVENDRVLAQREDVGDVGLDLNIALRGGDWDRIPAIVEKVWDRRASLNPSHRLTFARICSSVAPDRAMELAVSVADENPDNPHLLLTAYSIGIMLGKDDSSFRWLERAAELSKSSEGPVRMFSPREIIATLEESRTDWERKNKLYREGAVPLHMAMQLFNRTLLELTVGQAMRNERTPDARGRFPVPIRGGPWSVPPEVDLQRVALDVSALYVLHHLGFLQTVFQEMDLVVISPRTCEILFQELGGIAFHQPSRIEKARRMLALIHDATLLTLGSSGPDWLVEQAGRVDADMLAAARAANGYYVHSGPIYRAGSLMDELADLGEHAGSVVSVAQLLSVLRADGILTAAEVSTASHEVQGDEPVQSDTLSDRPLFLGQSEAQDLEALGLLAKISRGGRRMWVHRNAVSEWRALVDLETDTVAKRQFVESLRQTVVHGLCDGKVEICGEVAISPCTRGEAVEFNAPTLAILDIMEVAGDVDAVCLDDRVFRAKERLANGSGQEVLALGSIELLHNMCVQKRISVERWAQAIYRLRTGGYVAIPLEPGELEQLLKECRVDDGGQLRETAELKAVRENLARAVSLGCLERPVDLAYLDQLWFTGLHVMRLLWADDSAELDFVRAASNWIRETLMLGAEIVAPNAVENTERIEGIEAFRLSLLLQFTELPEGRLNEWIRWLETAVFVRFEGTNGTILDRASMMVIDRFIEMVKEIETELLPHPQPVGSEAGQGEAP